MTFLNKRLYWQCCSCYLSRSAVYLYLGTTSKCLWGQELGLWEGCPKGAAVIAAHRHLGLLCILGESLERAVPSGASLMLKITLICAFQLKTRIVLQLLIGAIMSIGEAHRVGCRSLRPVQSLPPPPQVSAKVPGAHGTMIIEALLGHP